MIVSTTLAEPAASRLPVLQNQGSVWGKGEAEPWTRVKTFRGTEIKPTVKANQPQNTVNNNDSYCIFIVCSLRLHLLKVRIQKTVI